MIGSMTSIFGLPFAAPYAASKGGIVQLTQALATAWAKDNIQVNTILPGWIDTALTVRGRADIPGLEERVKARTPAGRWGVPDDFARHRRVPGEPRLRLRHRHGHPGRRRLLGAGLGCGSQHSSSSPRCSQAARRGLPTVLPPHPLSPGRPMFGARHLPMWHVRRSRRSMATCSRPASMKPHERACAPTGSSSCGTGSSCTSATPAASDPTRPTSPGR